MTPDTLELEILRVAPPEGVARKPVPLVFLHGAFAGAWCWVERFLPYFAARGYTCYAPSFRGHGGSGGSENLDQFGIGDYLKDLISVIDDLDRVPVLIGHSMGGFVAMKYAEDHDIAGLALLSSVPPAGLIGPSMSLAMWNPMLMLDLGRGQTSSPEAMTMDGLRKALFSEHVPEALIKKYLPMMGGESSRVVAEMHGTVQVRPDRLRNRMPILVMGAAEDGLIPPPFVRSTARLLGETAHILPHTGHGIMLDSAWQTAADTLAQWLSEYDM